MPTPYENPGLNLAAAISEEIKTALHGDDGNIRVKLNFPAQEISIKWEPKGHNATKEEQTTAAQFIATVIAVASHKSKIPVKVDSIEFLLSIRTAERN